MKSGKFMARGLVTERIFSLVSFDLDIFEGKMSLLSLDKVQKMGIASLGQFSHLIILFKLL
jgi:hypothetical protein